MKDSIENQLIIRNGGKLRLRAMPKMKDYVRRYFGCTPHDLPGMKKLPYVYILYNVYGFKPKEIAVFFECSISYVYKIIADANFYAERSKRMQEEMKRIGDYIIYIAKYRD